MMLTEKLWIVTRIYKQFDPSFSLICYYSFIFGLLRISIGLSIFGFVANEYQWRAIRLILTIHNIRSAIRWAIPKVILNYLCIPSKYQLSLSFARRQFGTLDFCVMKLLENTITSTTTSEHGERKKNQMQF